MPSCPAAEAEAATQEILTSSPGDATAAKHGVKDQYHSVHAVAPLSHFVIRLSAAPHPAAGHLLDNITCMLALLSETDKAAMV